MVSKFLCYSISHKLYIALKMHAIPIEHIYTCTTFHSITETTQKLPEIACMKIIPSHICIDSNYTGYSQI